MAHLIVTNAADSGSGTLRQAIFDANGGDTIEFAADISNITLTNYEIIINKSLTINGPGSNKLTISGDNHIRVFRVSSGIDVTINGLLFTNGHAVDGGAISNTGTLTITNSTFSGNTSNLGGAISTWGGTLTITNSTISGNTAGDVGGAIFNVDGIFTITNSTFSDNTTSGRGGAIYTRGGTHTITNSTFSGNTAHNEGGAIYNLSTLKISFSTISENQAADGAGVYSGNGSVTFKNSIVGNNHGSNYTGPDSLALGVNFDTDDTCPGFTHVTSAALNLGQLALNAPGTTETHALLSGSVAIDSVTLCTDIAENAVTTDQRGVPRPQGTACDAGAYEAKTPCRGVLFIDIS